MRLVLCMQIGHDCRGGIPLHGQQSCGQKWDWTKWSGCLGWQWLHKWLDCHVVIMTTSQHGNSFSITGYLWWESSDDWWIPLTKGQQCRVLMFPLFLSMTKYKTNSWVACDLRCLRAQVRQCSASIWQRFCVSSSSVFICLFISLFLALFSNDWNSYL